MEWNGTIYKKFNISQINSELITYIHACMHTGASYIRTSQMSLTNNPNVWV